MVKNVYGSDAGQLTKVTSTTGSTTTTLISGIQYATTLTNFGGAYGQITGASLDGTTGGLLLLARKPGRSAKWRAILAASCGGRRRR